MSCLRAINNPRTPEGGWENQINGCDICGAICSAYLEVADDWLAYEAPVRLRICLGCIHKGIEEVHKTILKQCEKRI